MSDPAIRNEAPRCRARVLFLDLDGVLVDSSAVVRRSWSRWARQGTWAIVTSGTVPIARTRLQHVGLSEPEVFVTAEDVDRGKPDPQAYERAARLLEVDPGVGLVFEDSPAGVQAARGAGMRVIGVATTHGAESLAAADWVVASPAEVRVVAEDDGFSIYEREDGLGR